MQGKNRACCVTCKSPSKEPALVNSTVLSIPTCHIRSIPWYWLLPCCKSPQVLAKFIQYNSSLNRVYKLSQVDNKSCDTLSSNYGVKPVYIPEEIIHCIFPRYSPNTSLALPHTLERNCCRRQVVCHQERPDEKKLLIRKVKESQEFDESCKQVHMALPGRMRWQMPCWTIKNRGSGWYKDWISYIHRTQNSMVSKCRPGLQQRRVTLWLWEGINHRSSCAMKDIHTWS